MFAPTNKGSFEVFAPEIKLTQRQRKAFRKDPSTYLRRLFEEQGHKVNDFAITTEAERKAIEILDGAPQGGTGSFFPVIVHIVEGGGMASHHV
jgi:hypothetical protein